MNCMELNAGDVHDAFAAAVFVFFIQITLIMILAMIVFGGLEGFAILLPSSLTILGARFVCSILMHLQVEADMRQGVSMMKYVTNHPHDFSNPYYAFMVAMMQCMGGLLAEIFCIMFLCSLNDPINIIIRFVAFGSIAMIDNIYFNALSPDHKLKKRKPADFEIKNKRADYEGLNGKDRKFSFYVARFIYKTIRVAYASFIFYFLPYLAVFVPLLMH